jgi:hypothetical protein
MTDTHLNQSQTTAQTPTAQRTQPKPGAYVPPSGDLEIEIVTPRAMTRLSGWWMFAGTVLVLVGAFNVMYGVAAFSRREYFSEPSLIFRNLSYFAWSTTILGGLQIATALLIYARRFSGALLGIVFATLSAFNAFFAVGAYPWWALTIIATNVLVIYGLTRTQSEPASGW